VTNYRQVIAFKRYFLNFYESQVDNVQAKIEWTLQLIRTTQQVPEKYFKHMEETKGLFEIRVEVGNNIFRIFSFFDKGNLVVLGNGFQKKTQKIPKTEIEKALKIKGNTSMKKQKESKDITTLDEILDNKYGKKGNPKREKWEQEFEAFKLGVLLEEARIKLNMTQEELAEKCGTNKAYISRIENNASDIRLSTLMRIIQQGLGGQLKLTLQV
jgi:phage-related protein/DNA-binding XRE family transcriptional regulator